MPVNEKDLRKKRIYTEEKVEGKMFVERERITYNIFLFSLNQL